MNKIKGQELSVLIEADDDKANLWNMAFPDVAAFITSTLKAAWDFATTEIPGVEVPAGTPEVTVFLTDDEGIREINSQYRGIDKPTNILSFPAIEEDVNFTPDMTYLAGDIFISLTTTAREADSEGKDLSDHIAHLLIHSCLHLLGFDHETDEEASEMEELEIRFLSTLNIANPYEEM